VQQIMAAWIKKGHLW